MQFKSYHIENFKDKRDPFVTSKIQNTLLSFNLIFKIAESTFFNNVLYLS